MILNPKIVLVTLLLSRVACVVAGELEPFTSDGCSAFPDGTFEQKQLWLKCCTAHDFAYWKGGTYMERYAADKALQHCVEEVGEPAIALLMLSGVRVGGSPFFPTAFRWGYGWQYSRFYSPLTPEEKKQIEQHVKNSELLNERGKKNYAKEQ